MDIYFKVHEGVYITGIGRPNVPEGIEIRARFHYSSTIPPAIRSVSGLGLEAPLTPVSGLGLEARLRFKPQYICFLLIGDRGTFETDAVRSWIDGHFTLLDETLRSFEDSPDRFYLEAIPKVSGDKLRVKGNKGVSFPELGEGFQVVFAF